MRMKLKFKLLLFCIPLLILGYCQSNTKLEPGIDRWKIKVSAVKSTSNDHAKSVSLKVLMTLPLLEAVYSTDSYSEVMIPEAVGTLKEGTLLRPQDTCTW